MVCYLSTKDIYKAISAKHPSYKMESSRKSFSNWKNSIRHCLAYDKSFEKGNKTSSGSYRLGSYWKLANQQGSKEEKSGQVHEKKKTFVRPALKSFLNDQSCNSNSALVESNDSKLESEEKIAFLSTEPIKHTGMINNSSIQIPKMGKNAKLVKCSFCDEYFDKNSKHFPMQLKNHLEYKHMNQIAKVNDGKNTGELEKSIKQVDSVHDQKNTDSEKELSPIIHNGKSPGQENKSAQGHEKKKIVERPKMSYAKLISEALTNSSNGMLTVSDIYKAICVKHPYFKMETRGWKNCIKHNLSINKNFTKSEKKVGPYGFYWKQINIQSGHEKQEPKYAKLVKCSFCDEYFDKTSIHFPMQLKNHLEHEHMNQIAKFHDGKNGENNDELEKTKRNHGF